MKAFLLFVSLSLAGQGMAQQVVTINDPHIYEQQRRMVYANWGNFRPSPKYFLGIQTNIHYMMVWGWLAPSRNRSYRDGPDIRPLGPTGEQTQRMLLNTQLLAISREEKEIADSLAAQARSELYGHSALFAEVDPLWRLYYRKELKPVLEFDDASTITELSEKQLLYLKNSQLLIWYSDEMKRLQQRLEQAFDTDMERGARIMCYHRLLLEYRALKSRWDAQLNRAEQVWNLKSKGEQTRYSVLRDGNTQTYSYSDQAELMQRVIVNAATRTNP